MVSRRELDRPDFPSYKIYIEKDIPMIEKLLEYYRKSDGATKKKIHGCIFAEKLVLEKGRVATG